VYYLISDTMFLNCQLASLRNYGASKNVLEIDLGADITLATNDWLMVEAHALDPVGLKT
jgi:hypothetical protein